MIHKLHLLAGAAALSLALTGCGGGGGGGTSFIPQPPVQPPPPSPPPQQGQSVTIFPNPTVGEFASVGATVHGSADPNVPLGPISTADADQPHIRFMSDGNYYVQLPGHDPNELLSFGGGSIRDTDDNFEGLISGSKDRGYSYSELAFHRSSDPQQFGAFAFGTLTPDGAVPVTGSATYNGTITGTSDVVGSNAGQSFREIATGPVMLNFDFAAGTLRGAMSLGLIDEVSDDALQIGTFNFKDTVFGVGSTSYSGKFDTAAVGDNFFLGRFTGPHGEETIGAWALPFILDVGRAGPSNSVITADHQTHQAFGAWIAKRP